MSEKSILTMFDILAIQQFVFRSNRLRDAIVASQLIDDLSGQFKTLGSTGRLLMRGGGNAILIHTNDEEAKNTVANISRAIYDRAPELNAIFVHQEAEFNNVGQYARALLELLDETDKRKNNRALSAPLLGLSITAACDQTGLPAAAVEKDHFWGDDLLLSRGLREARSVGIEADESWQKLLNEVVQEDKVRLHLEALKLDPNCLAFTSENDKLGRSRGDTSLLAIVHVDVNGLGKRMRAWLEGKQNAENDNDTPAFELALQSWSKDIHKAARNTYKSILQRSLLRLNWKTINEQDTLFQTGKFEHIDFPLCRDKHDRYCLPIRPLVLGGDDITFACDARIALDLAETALHAIEGSKLPDLLDANEKLAACAGIALVQARAPIWRASHLAHELCANAKRWLLQNTEGGVSALDWQLCYGAPPVNLGDVRGGLRRGEIDLTMRPYPLGQALQSHPGWDWFRDELLGTSPAGIRGELWWKSRNKLKLLPELCRQSTDSLDSSMNQWNMVRQAADLPALKLPQAIEIPLGYFGQSTPLCDAIELLDLYQVLEKPASTKLEEKFNG